MAELGSMLGHPDFPHPKLAGCWLDTTGRTRWAEALRGELGAMVAAGTESVAGQTEPLLETRWELLASRHGPASRDMACLVRPVRH